MLIFNVFDGYRNDKLLKPELVKIFTIWCCFLNVGIFWNGESYEPSSVKFVTVIYNFYIQKYCDFLLSYWLKSSPKFLILHPLPSLFVTFSQMFQMKLNEKNKHSPTNRDTESTFQPGQVVELWFITTETITIAMTTVDRTKRVWTIWSKKRFKEIKVTIKVVETAHTAFHFPVVNIMWKVSVENNKQIITKNKTRNLHQRKQSLKNIFKTPKTKSPKKVLLSRSLDIY